MAASGGNGAGSSDEETYTCPSHPRPQLSCKFCRKSKNAVAQAALRARLAKGGGPSGAIRIRAVAWPGQCGIITLPGAASRVAPAPAAAEAVFGGASAGAAGAVGGAAGAAYGSDADPGAAGASPCAAGAAPGSAVDPSLLPLPITNTETYNVTALLRETILHSEYFKSLYIFLTPEAVCDEIRRFVEHVEPFVAGHTPRVPSTFVCCVYRLMTLRPLTAGEAQAMLDDDNVFVKCAAMLYLRFLLPPEHLMDWFRHVLLDDEQFSPTADDRKPATVGDFAESLLADDRYFGAAVLPRIPVRVRAALGAQLLALPAHRKRKEENKARLELFEPEAPVAVCNADGAWVEAYVSRLEAFGKGQLCCRVRMKEAPEATELVDLALVIPLTAKMRQEARRAARAVHRADAGLPQLDYSRPTRAFRRRRRRPRRGADRSPSPAARPAGGDFLAAFRGREQQKALAAGKAYARRPASYKTALSQRLAVRPRVAPGPAPNETRVLTDAAPAPAPAPEPQPSAEYRQQLSQLAMKYSLPKKG